METIPLLSSEITRHEKKSTCQPTPHKGLKDILEIAAYKSDDPYAYTYQSCFKDVGNGAAD